MTILAAEVTALFDPIMASIKTKLDTLATENHLKGAAYDEVYSAALSNTLQQVVQLIIGTDQRALTAAKVLTEEQTKLNLIAEHDGIVASTAKTDAERVKTEAETLLVPKQGQLLDQQLINAVAEKLNIQAKTNTLNAELLNIPKQGALVDAQTALENKNVAKADAEIANIYKQFEVITQEVLKSQAEVSTLNAKLLNIPKEGALLDSQIIGQTYENQLKNQQGLNLAAEALNIPKQGLLIDQQVLQSQGEVSLIPKKSAFMDAQIIELINRGQNLALEAIKLGLEGDNLRLQGEKLVLDKEILKEEIILKKAEEKNLEAERKKILTSAEENRSNAILNTAQTANIYGMVAVHKLKVMADTYNTYASHTPGVSEAFTTTTLNYAANNVDAQLNRVATTKLFL